MAADEGKWMIHHLMMVVDNHDDVVVDSDNDVDIDKYIDDVDDVLN